MAATLFYTLAQALGNNRPTEYWLFKRSTQFALVGKYLRKPSVSDTVIVEERRFIALGVRPFAVSDTWVPTDAVSAIVYIDVDISVSDDIAVGDDVSTTTGFVVELVVRDVFAVVDTTYIVTSPIFAVFDKLIVSDFIFMAVVGPPDTVITERLYPLLPSIYKDDDTQNVLRDLLNVLDRGVQDSYDDITAFVNILDPDSCPAEYLNHMLRGLGNPFTRSYSFPINTKRKMVKSLVQVYREKGTVRGVINAARLVLGMEVDILEYNLKSWHVGVELLGYDTFIAPSSGRLGRYHRFIYAFEVDVIRPRDPTVDEIDLLRDIVTYMKPKHTHFTIKTGDPTIDHWELGISELGVETLLHGGRHLFDIVTVTDFVEVIIGGGNTIVIDSLSVSEYITIFIDGDNALVEDIVTVIDSVSVDAISNVLVGDNVPMIERVVIIIEGLDFGVFDNPPPTEFSSVEFVIDIAVAVSDSVSVFENYSVGRGENSLLVEDSIDILELVDLTLFE